MRFLTVSVSVVLLWTTMIVSTVSAVSHELTIDALILRLNDPSATTRLEAAHALAQKGPEAAPAVAALDEAFRLDLVAEVKLESLKALIAIGHPSVPSIARALKDADVWVRYNAALALAYIGPAAGSAVADLAGSLRQESHADVRKAAAQALGFIGPAAGGGAGALAHALRDNSNDVRVAASWALGKIGPQSEDAVVALAEALRDHNPTVRYWAADALGAIGPAAESHIPGLVAALGDDNKDVRSAVVTALVKFDHAAVPSLAEALQGSGPIAFRAIDVLTRIGEPALGILAKTLYTNDSRLRAHASQALAEIGAPAVGVLIQAMQEDDATVRGAAAGALGDVGAVARSAVPVLADALDDPNPFVRSQAAWAMSELGPNAQAAIPALIAALRVSDAYVRLRVVEALTAIGPPSLPALQDALHRAEADVRSAVQMATEETSNEATGARQPRAARALPAGVWVDGEIRHQGQVGYPDPWDGVIYSFYAEAGSHVSITMESEDLESHLYLHGPNGAVVASNFGFGQEAAGHPAFLLYTIVDGGTHTVVASRYVGTGAFRIRRDTLAELHTLQRVLSEEDVTDVHTIVHDYTWRFAPGVAARLWLQSEDFDGRLEFFNSAGDIYVVDDHSGGGRDPLIRFEATTAGEYCVRVSSHGGRETGRYALQVWSEEKPLNATWHEATCSPSRPPVRILPIDEWVQGEIRSTQRSGFPNPWDGVLYAFHGEAGDEIAITMESSDFDPYLYLYEPGGKILASNDDYDPGEGRDVNTNSYLSATLPADGMYTVVASRNTGRGAFRLRLDAVNVD